MTNTLLNLGAQQTGPHTTTTMPKGNLIPEPIHWTIIQLSTTMKNEEIVMYMDVGVCKVEQILAHFRQTGDVDGPKQLQPPGPKATLGHHDVQVHLYLHMHWDHC